MLILIVIGALLSLCTLVLCAVLLLRKNAGGEIASNFSQMRMEIGSNAMGLRNEIARNQESFQAAMMSSIKLLGENQTDRLDNLGKQVLNMNKANAESFENLRRVVNGQLNQIQEKNEKKLEEMRRTVDEKLHDTLEKRLGESFKQVQDHLEKVHIGLGEMKTLATGVGDLKRVLTNVKTRGIWGEVQLGAILEQILTPDQYDRNVSTKKETLSHVEFAVKLPGNTDEIEFIWLPIDSKYPQESYQRIVDASEKSTPEEIELLVKDLLRGIEKSAKEISDKYLNPPYTTDFGFLFLPTEGLYAEVLRVPGFIDRIQTNHRIVIVGPTTLAATLNSLRMGFRSLAIEKRSSEVWNVLSAVKTEFNKFGDVLSKVKKQLDTASRSIEETDVRTRAMSRKLKDVEALPTGDSVKLLDLEEAADDGGRF